MVHFLHKRDHFKLISDNNNDYETQILNTDSIQILIVNNIRAKNLQCKFYNDLDEPTQFVITYNTTLMLHEPGY